MLQVRLWRIVVSTNADRGKRGGARVIYFRSAAKGRILLLLIYAKTQREDLTFEQLRILRQLVDKEYS